MCDSKVLHLKFVGMDSWERPVYKDGSGTLWKDVDPRARMQPDFVLRQTMSLTVSRTQA